MLFCPCSPFGPSSSDTAQVVIWLPWDAPSIVEKGKDMDVHSWPSAGPPGMRKDLVGKISDGAREGGSGKRSLGIFLVLHNQFFALLLLDRVVRAFLGIILGKDPRSS